MYRDAPLTGPSCYKHAAAPAAASCLLCDRTLCDPCIVYDLSAAHCIDCARRARRRRALGAVAKIGGALAVIAGAVTFLALRPQPFDYGADGARIAGLKTKAHAEPCDKRATLAYEEAALAAGDARSALADSDEFFARCGDWYRLRWVRYGAREHLSEHAAAVDEATRLIAHDPEDHDYYWWRGMAHEELGRDDAAIADYRKTLQLLPGADRIPFNLANVLERHQRLCEAREPILQFVRFHPEFAERPRIVEQLDRLRVLGHCADAH
jgi:tetratricopeptide (TPR) repeat protein